MKNGCIYRVQEDPVDRVVGVRFRGGPGRRLVTTIHAASVRETGMWFEKQLDLPKAGDQETS